METLESENRPSAFLIKMDRERERERERMTKNESPEMRENAEQALHFNSNKGKLFCGGETTDKRK